MKLYKLSLIFLVTLSVTTTFVHCGDEDEESKEDGDDDDAYPEEDDVLVLNEGNFDEAIAAHDTVLVEFYAPWCGHCKQLAPEYSSAAKELKDIKNPVLLAKVDATQNENLASKYDVSGYPTLKFFKKGVVLEYDGPRDSSGIVSYMSERSTPKWKPPPDAVVTLKESDFDDFINSADLALVEFYAPWCGHCKKIAPAYEQAAKDLKGMKIPLAKVDATLEKELAGRFEIKGYPTLKLFRKGQAYDYTGPMDAYGIIQHMIKMEGEASREKKTIKELKDFLNLDDITVIGFFDEEDPKLKVFMEGANMIRENYNLGHVLNKEIHKYYKIKSGSVVVFNAERFYTDYEPKWHVLNTDFTREDVVAFVKKHENPLVGHYDSTTEKKRYSNRRLCLVFYDVDFGFDHRDATQLWRRKIAKIAKGYPDILFAIADEEKNEEKFRELGLFDSPEEINIGCYGRNNKRYKMEPMEEFDSDEIKEFLDNLLVGNILPQVKSQPIPKTQGLVKTVVANNFDKIVNDKTKDVLIEFYAPWCGHCKQLEPKYKQLAKLVKKETNLVIAKFDATANDPIDGYEVKGFPTLFFAPANNKDKPIMFSGGREVEDMQKFIFENAAVSYKDKKDEL